MSANILKDKYYVTRQIAFSGKLCLYKFMFVPCISSLSKPLVLTQSRVQNVYDSKL